MSWYRKNPLFAFGLAVCALVALAEIAFTYERFAASREAAKRYEQRKTDLESMAQLTPPPTREVAAAIEADLTKAKSSLAAMQGELKGRGAAAERIHAAKVPTARTDAYFDLATFVEKTRELAKKNDVEVRPEAARFGFAAYANEGPETERIEPVFRQRQVAQYLIESLIAAHPRSLFAVKREPTLTKAEREARAAAATNGEPPAIEINTDSPDYFVIDPRVSGRVPGYVDTMAFRFVFTGQTGALRTFLNQLASFELPVLVREVEVDVATTEEATLQTPTDEPAAAEQPANSDAPSVVLSADAPAANRVTPKPPADSRVPRPSAAIPIVTKQISKFTVTVEYIELVPPGSAGAADPNAPPPPSPPSS